MTKPRVIVHVGPMKTGTTALGAYFSNATEAGILPKNVVYPSGDLWFPTTGRITKHGQLFDFLVEPSENTAIRRTSIRDAREVEDKVRAVAEHAASLRVTDPTVVFINETLSSRPNTEILVEMMRKYFSSVTFVLAVRSPFAAASSLLVHRIKDWRIAQYDFDIMAMIANEAQGNRFDYVRIIKRWTTNPSVSTVLIPIIEGESNGYASVDRFFAVVNGSAAPRLDDDFGSRRIHPSLPLKSLERLIALKKLNSRLGKVPLVGGLLYKLFLRTLYTERDKAVRAGFSERTEAAGDWVISDDERSQILNHYGDLGGVLRSALGKDANTPDWRAWFTAVGL